MRRSTPGSACATLLAGAVLAASCGRAQPEPRPAPAPTPPEAPGPDDSPPVAPGPEAAAPRATADCAPSLAAVSGAIARMHGAMDGGPYYDQARAAWQAVEPACRAGRWHLHAAQLLRWRGAPLPGFASAPAALTAGLTQPPDLDLLVLTAFTAALGQDPALPPEACDQARVAPPVGGPPSETADRVAYVCGHAALAAGDASAADLELARIANQRRYPDLPLRRAEALHALGRADDARRLARAAAALTDVATRAFGGTDREHDALIERAGSLR